MYHSMTLCGEIPVNRTVPNRYRDEWNEPVESDWQAGNWLDK